MSRHAGQAKNGAAAAAVARAVVISPDGKVVYVTGYSGSAGAYDYVTIAYDAATGKALWSGRYNAGGNDQGRAIAISPDGMIVYVTGRSFAARTGYDDATIAYNAATGKKLWVARYNGKASKNEFANAIAVSPSGKSVYITGGSHGTTSRIDFATVDYNAATGRHLWVGRYNGSGNLNDSGAGIAVSPDNATVVVTGGSKGKAGQYDSDWATIAYNAKTGAARWTKRYGSAFSTRALDMQLQRSVRPLRPSRGAGHQPGRAHPVRDGLHRDRLCRHGHDRVPRLTRAIGLSEHDHLCPRPDRPHSPTGSVAGNRRCLPMTWGRSVSTASAVRARPGTP